MDRGELPGLVTVVSRRGAVHVDTIGTTAIGGRDPMRRDTIFRITSMTKPITAAAAMILVEECALRLDDPVDRLLPELADRRVLRRLDGPLDDTVPANAPDRRARPADVSHGPRGDARSPGRVSDPASDPRARDRGLRAAGPLDAARAGRVDAPARDAAAHAPAGRAVAVQHGIVRAGRPDRARVRPAAGDVPARADIRAARHAGHGLQRPCRQARPARQLLPGRSRRPERSCCTTASRTADGAGRPRSRMPGQGSSRPSTTTAPSAR